MSRCFPFPPPGYEKKVKLDDANLILKEKHKEKKHKKDKEKKEKSERKDKSKGEKQKDDKDGKEKKHKDKKHKKRDKHKSSDDKKDVQSLENENGGKLVLDDKSHSETHDSKILAEFGKRLRSDDAAADNCLPQKIGQVGQGKPKLLEKVEFNNDTRVAHSFENVKEKRELSRIGSTPLKVNARDLENGSAASGQVHGEIQNKAGDVSSQVEVFRRNNETEKINQRNDYRKGNEHLRHEQRDTSEKAEDKKSSKEKKEALDSIKESIKKDGNSVKSFDFREGSHGLMQSLEQRGNLPKPKVPESNGFLHYNGVRLNNMSGAASFSHRGTQNGSNSHPSQNCTNTAAVKAAPTENHKANDSPMATANNHMVSNGFVSSPLLGIGKKTALCRTNPTVKQQLINSHSFDGKPFHSLQPSAEKERNLAVQKDSRKNGVIEEGTPSNKSKEKSERSKKDNKSTKKSPHPDLKYLEQILTVPRIDWPTLGDEEWLFGSSVSPSKKPKLAASSDQPGPTREVWDGAMRLEPTDVIALPYVIPY